MSSTLRRLSLTVQKRRRLAESKAGAASAGKAKGGKKRPKSENGGGGGGSGGGISAGLFDKETGEPIEINGILNRDGWIRLCGGEQRPAEGNGSSGDERGVSGDAQADSHHHNSSRQHGPTAVVRIGPASVAAVVDAEMTAAPPAPPATAAAAAAAANASSAVAGAGEGDGVLELDVVVNPPAVTSLECAVGLPMAGFSIVAQAEAEFETGLGWEWLREEVQEEGEQKGEGGAAAAAAAAGEGAGKKTQKNKTTTTGQPSGSRGFTRVVGTLRAYTPAAEDVGRRLMIRCTPLGATGRRGRPVVRVLTTPVRTGCEPGPLALRGPWLDSRRRTEGGGGRVSGDGSKRARRLRVMCYNILADMYCTSEQADKVLYPHCPRYFRAIDYRMQMVSREIGGHAADLIMLQECEAKAYARFLAPVLEFDGFQGIYLNKAGQAQEGEAIFYRSSVLTLEARHDFSMRDVIPALEEFRSLLEAFPLLSAIVEERLTTVAQIAVFRPTLGAEAGPEEGQEKEEGSSVRLIVANTHLYFHPNAAHIRLMQLVALVERVSRVRKDLISRGLRPAVILGGDLNSPPFGPVRYLMGEVIGPDSDLWSTVGTFKWGDRFFDEIAAAPGTAPLAAAAAAAAAAAPSASTDEDAPTPPPGGQNTSDAAATKRREGEADGACGVAGAPDPTAATAPRPAIKQGRPFLPGVPYLRVPLGLELVSGAPSFTNFTPEFTETLDYVFIEGGRAGTGGTANSGGGVLAGATEGSVLRVEGAGTATAAAAAVAPMPEEAPLRAVTPGLPSETFPSDHLSLVVDLEFVGAVAGE